MSGSSSGLSDILSDLAAGRDRPPRAEDSIEADAGPIEELGEAGPARPRPNRRAARRPASGGGSDLKAAAVPVLVTVATLLLIPAVWSVLILTGAWENDRTDARTMALAMLACWPIALCMYAGAAWLYTEVRKSRKRQ